MGALTRAVLLTSLCSSAALAQSSQLHNIKPTLHAARAGATLEEIGASIEAAVQRRSWQVDASEPGAIQASIWVRSKHQAVVRIGFDTANFWIDYVSSHGLDYNPKGRPPTHKGGRGIKGPRIHRNYNNWVELLAVEIRNSVEKRIQPVRPAREASAPPRSTADELEKLDALRQRGVLTQEEFEQQKAKLLGR